MADSAFQKFPAVPVAWGGIGGTLSNQTDLAAALALKAPLASPTFTGTVGLPAGQAVNGVTLSTAGPSTQYLNKSGTYTTPAGATWGAITGTLSAQADLSAALNAKLSALRRRRAVCVKAGAFSGLTSSVITGGPYTSCTSHVKHYAPSGSQISDLQFAFPNWIVSGAETVGANDISVKANIVYNSRSYPIWFQGQRTVTIKPGATVWSDILGIEIPAGASFFTSTYVSISSGTWPQGRTPITSLLEGTNLSTDTTDVTTWAATTGWLVYSPSAIIGSCASTSIPSVAYYGDSIAVGYGDNGDAFGNQGYFERSFYSAAGYISAARSSETLANFLTQHSCSAGQSDPWCDAAIFEYGINDIVNNLSLATMQANMTAAWTLMANRGMKVYQTTITPRTNSSNAWISLGGQSIPSAPQELVRTQLNDWIRTTPSPLSGYIEVADVCETARNSGFWVTNGSLHYYTDDGTHPLSTACIAIAAVLTPLIPNFLPA